MTVARPSYSATMLRPSLLAVAALALALSADAGASPYTTPKVGSPERVAICDALRAYVQKEVAVRKLPKKIVFKVEWLRVSGDFAFFMGFPIFEDGGSPYTDYLPDMAYYYLLQRKASGWQVIADFSGTDVPGPEWWAKMKRSLPAGVPACILDDFHRGHLGM